MQDVEYACLARPGSCKLESITCPTRCGSFGSTCARNVRKAVLNTEASVGHALPRVRLRAWPKRGQLEWYLSRTTSTFKVCAATLSRTSYPLLEEIALHLASFCSLLCSKMPVTHTKVICVHPRLPWPAISSALLAAVIAYTRAGGLRLACLLGAPDRSVDS